MHSSCGFFIFLKILCIGVLYFLLMMIVLEPERANAQSHATVLRLPQNESAGAKELTQPNGMKTLMQHQKKDGRNQRPSHF